ncbi:MAG: ATP-grasp domain-containing protein [Planctomycetota bacterium]
MPNVVFVAPFAMSATLRFARAAAGLPGVRLGVLSQQPESMLRAQIPNLAAHRQVGNAMDVEQLVAGVRALAPALGGEVDTMVGILEQAQEPIAAARTRLGLPGMSVEATKNFRDKSRMKDLLRAHDLPCARHALVGTAAEGEAFAQRTGFPLVVKPPAGAGAKNTFRVDDATQLRQCLQAVPPSPARPVLIEEFIVGREYSYDAVSLGGQHLFHSISEYYPSPLEVMETPWIQWCVLLPREIDGDEFAPIRDAAPRALSALGMDTGMTHTEWFRREDGSIAISEVAARPPGAQFVTLLSLAHDLDFYRAWAQLMVFGSFDPPERQWSVGVAFLRGQGSGNVVAIRGVEEARREIGSLIVEAKLPQRGQTPAGSYEGEGYVILRHPETQVVKDGLARLVTLLRVELG